MDKEELIKNVWYPHDMSLLIRAPASERDIKGPATFIYEFVTLRQLIKFIGLYHFSGYLNELTIIRRDLHALNAILSPSSGSPASHYSIYGLVEPGGPIYQGSEIRLHFLGNELALKPDLIRLGQAMAESTELIRQCPVTSY